MQYRNFGKQGYDVSLLGMGCMRLPRGEDASVDREKAIELIQYAADHGINYFDTAYGYHNRTSEEVLGEALASGGRRGNAKIATKQPFGVMTTQADIRRNLENTLRKLRTDYIDVYLVHGINGGSWPDIQKREILKEYEKFKAEGLIRAIAFSYHGGYDAFAEVLGGYDWDMCQVQHNFMDTDREVTAKGLELAGQKGCALVVMEPLRGGNLGAPTDAVKEIYASAERQYSSVEWAFRYVANFPQVSTILSGMSTLEQLKENITLFSQADMQSGCLDAADLEMLQRVKQTYESVVSIPCTACEYCMPCPQGVKIPEIFKLYNTAHMFENMTPSRRVYMFVTRGEGDVSHCVKCGACETKCPQGIAIMEGLETAHNELKGWTEI